MIPKLFPKLGELESQPITRGCQTLPGEHLFVCGGAARVAALTGVDFAADRGRVVDGSETRSCSAARCLVLGTPENSKPRRTKSRVGEKRLSFGNRRIQLLPRLTGSLPSHCNCEDAAAWSSSPGNQDDGRKVPSVSLGLVSFHLPDRSERVFLSFGACRLMSCVCASCFFFTPLLWRRRRM